MTGSKPVEMTERKGWTLGVAFVPLMVAIVGLGALFDPSSPFGVRLVGALAALVFGTGAWLLLRGAVRRRRSLLLDASGLRLLLPNEPSSRYVPWRDLLTVRLENGNGVPVVALDYDDPDARPPYAKGDEPHRTLRLPRLEGHRPEDVAAQIERFRLVYAVSEPTIRREDMM